MGKTPRAIATTMLSLALGLGAAPSGHAQEHTVGILAGLSGGGAQIGQWMVRGAEVAADTLNKSGSVKFKLVTEDTQWNPQKTVEAFNKVVNVDGARMMMVGGSSALQAVAPIGDQRQIVMMNIGAQSPAMAGVGKYVFSALQLSDVDVQAMAKYAHDRLGLRRVGIMYVNNDTGKVTQAEFGKRFEEAGGKVLAREAFNVGDSNFGVQIAKLRTARPDSVYLVGEPGELPFAVKQLRSLLPAEVKIVSYAGIESAKFVEAAGDAGNGIVYSTTFFDPTSTNPRVQEFVAAYKAKYNESPSSPYVTYTYDAMNILARALAEAKTTGEPLRAAILKIRRFPGVTGDTVFRDDGTVVKTIAIKEIRGGKFELVTTVQP
jgi:branched-chain amino acid transport system substrate-binding protein